MRNRLAAAATLLAVLTVRPAVAQEDLGDRKGLTASLGLGVGSAGMSCVPQCAGDRQSGPALMLRVGGHVSPQFSLGAETSLFRADVKGTTSGGKWALSWFALTAVWYPSSEDDFFIKFGAGIASVRADVEFPVVGPIELTSSDFGGVVGIGKDFRIADRWAITAFADALFTPRSQALTSGSNSGAKLSADLIHLGLAVTIP